MPTAPSIYRPPHMARRREHRASPSVRGYDRTWQRLREMHLSQQPFCQHCMEHGLIVVGEHVDHIRPFHGKHDPLRLDSDNLQTLCHSCHSSKTAKERMAGG